MMTTGLRLVGLLLCLGVLLTACGKEEKPPPPPPRPAAPPPPPPPEPVDVQALLQNLGADARVQFPQPLAPTDRALAESVIRIADAIARGDETTLRAHIDDDAERVLDALTASGRWHENTSAVEAVRVVYLAGSSGGGGGGGAEESEGGAYTGPRAEDLDTYADQLEALVDEAIARSQELTGQELPQAQIDFIKQMMRSQMQQFQDMEAMSPEVIGEIRKVMLAQIERQLGGEGSSPAFNRPLGDPADLTADVVLAVQDDEGAYLLGWRREGEEFTNVAVSAGVRRFARDWDNASLAELAPRPLVMLEESGVGRGPDTGEPESESAAGGRDAPRRDRNVKQTPRGPVTVPSSPGTPGGSG